jgi:plasmid stabilization system protein ParE
MSRRFIVRPLAEADLEDAARWYEDERAGLAERFLSDVDRTFARIRERPLHSPQLAVISVERCYTLSLTLFTFGRLTRWLSCSVCCT